MITSIAIRKIESLVSVPLGQLAKNSFDKRRLSGDAFSKMADVALFKDGCPEPSLLELRNAQVVFLAGHNVEGFIDNYLAHCSPKILIVGDGDRDWSNFEFPELRKIKRIFIQNWLEPNDSKFICLPIGIENRKYGRNGMPYNFFRYYATRKKKLGIFLGPLGNTHPIRERIANLDLTGIQNLKRLKERVSSVEFAYRSSKWSHVASPRGNGHDTHRFWETLYRGSIPIITEDQWSKNLAGYGIPFETVSDWTVDELTRVAKSPNRMPLDPNLIGALWQPYWRKLINEVL